MATKTFKISGMHCAACATGSEKSINVCPNNLGQREFSHRDGVVEYDPALVKFAEIKARIHARLHPVELEDKRR